eukprot:357028-Chlamydomonas_euryale.AAC.3
MGPTAQQIVRPHLQKGGGEGEEVCVEKIGSRPVRSDRAPTPAEGVGPEEQCGQCEYWALHRTW